MEVLKIAIIIAIRLARNPIIMIKSSQCTIFFSSHKFHLWLIRLNFFFANRNSCIPLFLTAFTDLKINQILPRNHEFELIITVETV